MKKVKLTIAFALLLFTGGAQTRYTHNGNTLLYYATYNPDGTHKTLTAISINDIPVSEDQNKGAWECFYKKKVQCQLDRACREFCSENPACEIAWWTACVFDLWFRMQTVIKLLKIKIRLS